MPGRRRGLIFSHRFVGITNDLFDRERHYITVWTTAEAPAGEPHLAAPEEMDRIGWFAPDQLPSPLFLSLRNFLGPLSEYRVYLVQQSAAAVDAATALATAIKAGDLGKARTQWQQARLHYKRIEPIAYRLSDLENAIDPVADYLEKREADPAFTGFHRIEYGLYAHNSTDGLAQPADRLVADLTALKGRLGKVKLDPAVLLAIPGGFAGQLAQGKILNGEDRYAHSDLADFAANFAGIAKITGLLQAVVRPVDPALDAEIAQRLGAVHAALAKVEYQDQATLAARYREPMIESREPTTEQIEWAKQRLAGPKPELGKTFRTGRTR